jgi:CubicO group peptidase (beta-lactamase class C family)
MARRQIGVALRSPSQTGALSNALWSAADAINNRVSRRARPLADSPRLAHCPPPLQTDEPFMSSFALPYAPSETVGFIPQRLERITAIMARQVEEKKAPGVSMLIARHGKIAYRQSVGALGPGGPPMSDDAIFRIYSMTKPIVSVAAMMLVEEGRLLITDPVSKYVPGFASAQVGVVTGDKLQLAPLKRPVTVQDLMRHTSGLTYGFTGASPVQKLIKGANVVNSNRTLAENVEAMAALPLMHQPGEVWEYGLSTDALGRIVEIVEGASLGEILHERLFRPLHMVDTAFYTPPNKVARRADPFSFEFLTAGGVDSCNGTAPPKFESGGGGLMSTLADYTRFAAMLSFGGVIDGVRILGPQTLAFMASDHLGEGVRKDHYLLWPGHGFGLGFAVRTDPGKAPTAGSVGEFFWGGMMGTAFWVSPRDSLFAVLMVQTPENREYFRVLFRNLVTAAIA